MFDLDGITNENNKNIIQNDHIFQIIRIEC